MSDFQALDGFGRTISKGFKEVNDRLTQLEKIGLKVNQDRTEIIDEAVQQATQRLHSRWDSSFGSLQRRLANEFKRRTIEEENETKRRLAAT